MNLKDDKDVTEKYEEKFRELRVQFMGVLEEEVKAGNLSLWDVPATFAKATKMDPAKAYQYLKGMASPGSRFLELRGPK